VSKSAIGDLAGIIGGPIERPRPTRPKPEPKPKVQSERGTPEESSKPSVVEIQPRLIASNDEQSDRITVILPISLLTQVDGRIAALRRKKKVSVSGYIEAALRELLATGERDVEALERHRVSARRTVAKVR
jgi:hypothetical protein